MNATEETEISLAEAAVRLREDPSRTFRRVQKGELRGRRTAGGWLLRLEDVTKVELQARR